MLSKRTIPILLLKGQGLVKTTKFKAPKYLGDPLNAVRIFNEKEADELVFLDITATTEDRGPNFNMIQDIAAECFMPFAYGGGLSNYEDVQKTFRLGAEKVIFNNALYTKPELIQETSSSYGAQAVVISIDVKRNLFGQYIAYTHNGTKNTKTDIETAIKHAEQLGAGEILINAIEHDGTMKGYDLKLFEKLQGITSLPVVACGGCGSIDDMRDVLATGGASDVAAGSFFVFHGPHRAVLITYPQRSELSRLNK